MHVRLIPPPYNLLYLNEKCVTGYFINLVKIEVNAKSKTNTFDAG